MAGITIFDEDLVLLENSNGSKFGLVLECAENASSDEEDNEDDGWENVKKGTVRVAWHPGGKEEIVQEKKLTLADRSLMPGDVVRRLIEGQDSQRGFVRTTKVTCNCQVLTTRDKVILGVDSTRIEPQKLFDVEPGEVFLDSWVGRVERIVDKVVLRFPDGAMCEALDDEFYTTLCSFEDVHEKRNADSEFCVAGFYRGQIMRGDYGDLEKCTWLRTTKHHSPETAKKQSSKQVTVTVHQVEAEEIEVHWLCRGYAKLDSAEKMEPPPKKLNREHIQRLKKLDCFESSSVQIGDKGYFILSENDKIESFPTSAKHSLMHHIFLKSQSLPSKPKKDKGQEVPGAEPLPAESVVNGVVPEMQCVENDKAVQTTEELEGGDDDTSDTCSTASSTCSSSSTKKKASSLQWRLLRKPKLKNQKKKKQNRGPVNPEYKIGDCVPVEIIYTSTVVEVVWQDGSVEKVSSTELFPIHHLDELEYFPGDFVLPQSTGDMPDDCYGVVQKVDHAGRTMFVKWLRPYHLGKAISRDKENWPTEMREEEMSVYDVKDHMEYKFRPGVVVVRIGGYDAVVEQGTDGSTEPNLEAAGQVYDLANNGSVIISWASGRQTTCYPQDLYIVGDELLDKGYFNILLSELDDSEYGSDEDSDAGSGSDSEASWETENEEELDVDDADTTNDISVNLPADDIDKINRNLVQAQSRLASLSDLLDKAVTVEFEIMPIYQDLIFLYRSCKRFDKELGTEFVDDNTDLKDCVCNIRQEMMMEKTVRVGSKVLHMFSKQEKGGEEGSSEDEKESAESGNNAASAAQNGNSEASSAENGKSEASANDSMNDSTLEAAKSKLQEQLLPPEKAKELCVNTVNILKQHVNKAYQYFTSKYQDQIQAPAEIEVMAEGSVEGIAQGLAEVEKIKEEVKNTTEEIKESIKEAKEKMTLEITDPAVEEIEAMLAKTPGTPQTPAEVRAKIEVNLNGFTMVETVPESHRFFKADHQPNNPGQFFKALRKELKLLQSSLPKGIFVKGFEDRMDVFTAMVEGPAHTPYEDALFFFDIQLPADFPAAPPLFHYHSFCSDRLNPNLYEDGKVCVSLLGTWTGKGTEVWTSGKSSLLQVLISIQGLILVPEPYYNEAGYEKQRGTQQGSENSRMYNEMAMVKVVQAMTRMVANPPILFKDEVHQHMNTQAKRLYERLDSWLNVTSVQPLNASANSTSSGVSSLDADDSMDIVKGSLGPEFPLMPISKGFRLSLVKQLQLLHSTLVKYGYLREQEESDSAMS